MKKSYFLLIVFSLILLSAIVLRFINVGSEEEKPTKVKLELKLNSDNNILSSDSSASSSPNIFSEEEASFSKQALVVSPKRSELISSPLKILGNVVGSWFFEGSMPIKLVDANNNLIASGLAKSDKDWMTEKPVPFSASLEFLTNATSGFLVISKDNPSGLPENDGFIKVPVRFK